MAEQMSYLQRIQAVLLDGRTSHLDDEDIAYFVGRALGLTPSMMHQPVGSLVLVPVEMAAVPEHDVVANLDQARSLLDHLGGWLLHLRAGHYLVTQDADLVIKLRGQDWYDACEVAQQWDETMLAARPGAKEGGA